MEDAADGAVRDRLTRRNRRLMRHPRRWLAASVAVLVLAASGIVVRGVDLGVEFTGGRLIEYATSAPVDADGARTALAETCCAPPRSSPITGTRYAGHRNSSPMPGATGGPQSSHQ